MFLSRDVQTRLGPYCMSLYISALLKMSLCFMTLLWSSLCLNILSSSSLSSSAEDIAPFLCFIVCIAPLFFASWGMSHPFVALWRCHSTLWSCEGHRFPCLLCEGCHSPMWPCRGCHSPFWPRRQGIHLAFSKLVHLHSPSLSVSDTLLTVRVQCKKT